MADRFRWDDFLLDLDTYRLERAGAPVPLEPKALNLLALMVRRPGHLFTKQEIFDAVWPGTAVTDHALTRIVAQVRRALGDEAREARYLETVPTRGYRWVRRVEMVPAGDLSPDAASVPADPGARRTPATPAPDRSPFRTAATAGGIVLAIGLAAVMLRTFSGPASGADDTRDERVSTPAGGHDVDWPVQVTTNAGLDFQPALSPHGDAVAFASDRSGAFEIYVRALDGTATDLPLTNDGAQNVHPAWSPDGRYLAYHSSTRGGIWIVPSRGGTPRQLTPEGSKPAWSPDGAAIAYQSDEHADAMPTGFGAQAGSTIRLVSASGGDPGELTRTGSPMGGHAAPAWSPDGRFLSFTVFEAGPENGLWLLDRQTGATAMLRQGNALFESAFSPDGSTVYVAGGDAFILRLPFDASAGRLGGQGDTIPVPGVPGVRGLTVSADGSRVGFAGLGLDSQIWAQPIGSDGRPAGLAVPLTRDTSRRNSLPALSPDGSRVAYNSSRGGEASNVWVMNADGTGVLQLTTSRTPDVQPAWTPDGKRVAYLGRRGDGAGLWTVDVATRMEATLVDVATLLEHSEAEPPAGRLAEVRLSGSMTRIAFSLFTPPTGRRTLYVSAIAPFSPRPIGNAGSPAGYPAWSPDERSIAVEVRDGTSTQAGVVDLETGTLRIVTSGRGHTWVRSWSPDGTKIAAAVLRDGTWSLRWIAADGSGEGLITPPGPPRTYVRYPDWSRGGDLIVFERGEMRGNIWMLPVQ